ncbi:hypothetical protein [Streptomyces milbemycinicus]|uniref:hypothetical protein n=1 Tax=Streptomyces milbemycinicus TaxID=476552 RepID=UPI000A3CA61D|nr:hypothetical protein [Streptomyces milbemycinicus]
MTVEFATRIEPMPSWFEMPCIACELTGHDGEAVGLVTATSGLGLAACVRHIEVTDRVLRRLRNYDLVEMRASFVSAGLTTEWPTSDSRKPVEISLILSRVRFNWPDTEWVLREPPNVKPSLAWTGGPSVDEVGEELGWPHLVMMRSERP